MKRELEERLAREFPFMRRRSTLKEQEEAGGVHDLYGAFGCDCGDGWYELLRGLCTDISTIYDQAGISADIIVDQVKEKFGTLRFYWHREGQSPGIQAIDFIGGPSLRPRRDGSAIDSKIEDAVRKWEEASECVCDRCGKPRELRTELRYILTLCDSCFGAQDER